MPTRVFRVGKSGVLPAHNAHFHLSGFDRTRNAKVARALRCSLNPREPRKVRSPHWVTPLFAP